MLPGLEQVTSFHNNPRQKTSSVLHSRFKTLVDPFSVLPPQLLDILTKVNDNYTNFLKISNDQQVRFVRYSIIPFILLHSPVR